jgi:hypothetical protein
LLQLIPRGTLKKGKILENQHKKITGYRELSQEEINLMNEIKAKGVELELLVNKVMIDGQGDVRWASIAKTELQQGLMALTRAIAKPESF